MSERKFQVMPAVIVFAVIIIVFIGLALVNADFNRGVKETFGVDIAGTLDNGPLPFTASMANTFKFSSDCASQLCDVAMTNSRGEEESYELIAPRTWSYPGMGYLDYFITVRDSEGKSATCTIYGDGKLIESDSSVSSDATCRVNR